MSETPQRDVLRLIISKSYIISAKICNIAVKILDNTRDRHYNYVML